MKSASLLSIRYLNKPIQGRELLRLRDVEIRQGQAYVLTGINGAGKSMFMRVLAGLESFDEACVQFRGEVYDWRAYPRVLREQIVYVHQHPVMLRMSVANNVAYGLRMRQVGRVELRERVEAALHWAGVMHLRDRMPQGLSGGEKQRIALARAQVLDPSLLLLDEPTANLDGQAREQVLALIGDIVRKERSVLMACHDRDLIHFSGVQHWKLKEGVIELK